GVPAVLAGADAHDAVDVGHPQLPVADPPGAGGLGDRLDEAVDVAVVGQHVDADLGHEVDRVLGAPVDLGVPRLAPEALHLGDRHAGDAGALEGALDLVELGRLDDRGDELHGRSSVPVARSGPSTSARRSWRATRCTG